MVTCNDCIHRCVCPIADGCEYADEQHIRDDCEYFAYTADVVPKSEVDLYRKQVDELEDELASTYDKLENAKVELEAMRTAANSYKMHYENLAREIKRTKAMLLDSIDTFRNLLCIESWLDYEDTIKHYVVSIDDVNRIHDELKKKYKVVQ